MGPSPLALYRPIMQGSISTSHVPQRAYQKERKRFPEAFSGTWARMLGHFLLVVVLLFNYLHVDGPGIAIFIMLA